MSNMEDWVRQQADTHKKEKQEQAEAEKKANEEVQALQQAVVKGAQPSTPTGDWCQPASSSFLV